MIEQFKHSLEVDLQNFDSRIVRNDFKQRLTSSEP
jgi:hypothetical protein